MTFDAKVDLWFTGVMLVSALVNFGPALLMKARLHKVIRALLVVCGLGFVGGTVFVHLESYRVDERTLSSEMPIFGGPIAKLEDIIAVTPSRDGRSSRGASFDRLRIDIRNQSPVFVAVHDKAGFLNAIANGAPQLTLRKDRLVSR